MCDDECSEANERDDQSNIGETLQHYTIHMRERDFCKILCIHTYREGRNISMTSCMQIEHSCSSMHAS